MEIDGPLPRIVTSVMRDRVSAIMTNDCGGWGCPGGTGRFTKRLINGAVTVHIQCTGCGRSLSGALKRDAFTYWQDFPAWDTEVGETHKAALHDSHMERLADIDAAREQRETEAARRRAEYSQWLLTSREWQTLRDRAWRRAGGLCEACLANQAKDIHHLTYRLGRLPPAWELRAVCRSCHDRLHDWIGGEE